MLVEVRDGRMMPRWREISERLPPSEAMQLMLMLTRFMFDFFDKRCLCKGSLYCFLMITILIQYWLLLFGQFGAMNPWLPSILKTRQSEVLRSMLNLKFLTFFRLVKFLSYEVYNATYDVEFWFQNRIRGHFYTQSIFERNHLDPNRSSRYGGQ